MAAIVDTIQSTLSENFAGTHDLAKPEHQFSLEDVPDLSGKVAVVTGGSEGIGYGVTHTLLSHSVKKLFIISMSQKIVDNTLKAISEELGSEAAQKVTWLQCDLTDWKAVAQTAKKISESTDRLDILVKNAARGIMTYKLSNLGVDEHMALNHIGHVILTSHILPLLKTTASKGNTVRIVCLGSNAHQGTPSNCKFASLSELNQDLSPNSQYGRSKLAQMLYCKYLSKHLTSKCPDILANSVHPGFVDTRQSNEHIHEAYPLGGYAMSIGMKPFKKSQWEGCVSAMFAATKTERSGQYICPPARPEQGSKMAQDEELAESLMELTKGLIKEKVQDDVEIV